MPIHLSYTISTPRRVRSPNDTSSPRRQRSSVSSPAKWIGRFAMRIKAFQCKPVSTSHTLVNGFSATETAADKVNVVGYSADDSNAFMSTFMSTDDESTDLGTAI
ncbi:hypothetical protein Moror_14133 [Moniliophthora roreri MCA 2997]|uniref:Uncharacterized protein n=1 Tax=Moniliophthora roreri (strain MCA 2997) TaxID=1381753 RepID=V2XQN9_MONRO|nr:hypothetical protein Moror_14133 [Moniliophthora roreri MCA 2997]